MQTNLVKAAVMGAWIVAVAAFGYLAGTTTLPGWALVAVVAFAPPVFMGRLWTAPPQTMSEAIRKALR